MSTPSILPIIFADRNTPDDVTDIDNSTTDKNKDISSVLLTIGSYCFTTYKQLLPSEYILNCLIANVLKVYLLPIKTKVYLIAADDDSSKKTIKLK